MIDLSIAILTAPRLKDTARRMLLGMRFVTNRPEVIHLFAEPGSVFPDLDFIEVHQNERTMGCFRNFDQAHRYLIEETDSEWILVMSDDVKYRESWIVRAEEYVNKLKHSPDFGYLALYTPVGMKQFFSRNPHKEIIYLNRGWGKGGWGGLYLMRRETAQRMINTKVYQNHKDTYTKNQQFDECVKEAFMELGLDQFYVNPSLFDHVGMTSTIGHNHRALDKGLNWGRNT